MSDQQAPEHVRRDGEQVVAEREQLAARGRLAAEPVLGKEPVEDDDRGVREREQVDDQDRGHASGGEEGGGDRGDEERLLPGGDDVERRAAHARFPELRHDQVVERQPDREHEQREPGSRALT